MSEDSHGFGTIAIHGGKNISKWGMNQVVPPIVLTTTHIQSKPGAPTDYTYIQDGNPTRDNLQDILASLENARFCRTFSSGMAVVDAIAKYFKFGDHVILNSDGYGGTLKFFHRVATDHYGFSVSTIDLTDLKALESALNTKTRLLWFESATNPLLKIVDIVETVKIARAYDKDIIIVVDNTFMTPFFQRPLEFGVDIVMHSLTKYINGHSDVLMGAAMTNREDLDRHLSFTQSCSGTVPSPFDCYMTIRGVKTLHLRMEAHMRNGLAVAKWLESDPRVEKVIYPELESHPQHKIHKKQAKGTSGMISFYLKGGLAEAEIFFQSIKVFTLAESLGGCESLAKLPSIMTPLPVEEIAKLGFANNLIRLSVGLEDKEDLIRDLDQALSKAVRLEE